MRCDTRTAIVTDTTSDLPTEIISDLPISVVSNILVLDGKSYLDGSEISREEFYALLSTLRTIPTTASPAPGTFQALYKELLASGFSNVISIHPPAALSGLFNSASVAAQAFKGAVKVLDSGQLSLGMGFQALVAAEESRRGLSWQDILNRLVALRQRIRVVAMLDTLEFVRRSGRVSWARASLGSLMNVKPFITLKDGKVLSLGETRTRRRGIERLREMLLNLGPLERLAILHSNAESEAQNFMDSLNLQLPTPLFKVNVTTIIGTHIGPNGLGFAAVLNG